MAFDYRCLRRRAQALFRGGKTEENREARSGEESPLRKAFKALPEAAGRDDGFRDGRLLDSFRRPTFRGHCGFDGRDP